MAAINEREQLIDVALFNATQPHFVVPPMFQGRADPITTRTGFVRRTHSTVPLVLRRPRSVVTDASDFQDPVGWRGYAERIGVEGYNKPLWSAIRSAVAEADGWPANFDEIYDDLKSRVEDARPQYVDRIYRDFQKCVIERTGFESAQGSRALGLARPNAIGRNSVLRGETEWVDSDLVTLPGAAARLATAVRAFHTMEQKIVAIRATPGVGKTRAAMDGIIEQTRRNRVDADVLSGGEIDSLVAWFCVNTNEIALQKSAEFHELLPDDLDIRIIPYHGMASDTAPSGWCYRKELAKLAAERGVAPSALCGRGTESPCPHSAQCGVMKAAEAGRGNPDAIIYVLPFEFLTATVAEELIRRPNLAVIDEDFMRAVLHADTKPRRRDALFESVYTEEGAGLMTAVLDAVGAEGEGHPLTRIDYTKKQIAEIAAKEKEARDAAAAVEINPAASDGEINAALLRLTVKDSSGTMFFSRLQDDFAVRNSKGQSSWIRAVPGTNGFAFTYRKPLRRLRLAGRDPVGLLILDATMSRTLVERALSDGATDDEGEPKRKISRYEEINVRRNIRSTLIYGAFYRKMFFDGAGGLRPDQQGRVVGAKLIRAALEIVRHRTGGAREGLIVTYKGLVEPLREILPEFGMQDWSIIYYGNARATNDFSGVRRVVVLGDNIPNPHGIANDARALAYDQPEEISEESVESHHTILEAWSPGCSTRPRRTWSFPVKLPANAIQREMTLQKMVGELEQAIERVRSARAEGDPVQLLIFGRISPIPVNEVVYVGDAQRDARRERRRSPRGRLEQAWDADGGLLRSARYLARRFPEIWADEKQAKSDLGRFESGAIFGGEVRKILVAGRRGRPLTYEFAGSEEDAARWATARLPHAER